MVTISNIINAGYGATVDYNPGQAHSGAVIVTVTLWTT
jgi:hypothetical protein